LVGAFTFVIALAAAALLLWQLRFVVVLLFGAVLISTIFRAIADLLEKYLRLPNRLAVLFSVILVVGVIAAVVWAIGAQVAAQGQNLVDTLPRAAQIIDARLASMGFGHPVYRSCDPRSDIVKAWAQKLSASSAEPHLYAISERIETVMKREKNLFPNLDFFSASAFHFLGVPTPMFTPIFVFARIAGWSAHIIEQRVNRRLIRPTAEYTGASPRAFVPISRRG